MLETTKGIFLHKIKYSDNSIIAHIYTEKFGRLSFIVQGLRSKKAKNKISLLQPFFLLDMQIYYRNGKNLQRLKEVTPDYNFSSIPYHNIKRTVALFVSELLYKVLKEEEENYSLFNFIRKSAVAYDLTEKSISDFHLLFLTELTRFLGFYPQNNYDEKTRYFDLTKGYFCGTEPKHNLFISPEIAEVFSGLMREGFSNLQQLVLQRTVRKVLLDKLLQYYQLHVELPMPFKSLNVMQQIFK